VLGARPSSSARSAAGGARRWPPHAARAGRRPNGSTGAASIGGGPRRLSEAAGVALRALHDDETGRLQLAHVWSRCRGQSGRPRQLLQVDCRVGPHEVEQAHPVGLLQQLVVVDAAEEGRPVAAAQGRPRSSRGRSRRGRAGSGLWAVLLAGTAHRKSANEADVAGWPTSRRPTPRARWGWHPASTPRFDAVTQGGHLGRPASCPAGGRGFGPAGRFGTSSHPAGIPVNPLDHDEGIAAVGHRSAPRTRSGWGRARSVQVREALQEDRRKRQGIREPVGGDEVVADVDVVDPRGRPS